MSLGASRQAANSARQGGSYVSWIEVEMEDGNRKRKSETEFFSCGRNGFD